MRSQNVARSFVLVLAISLAYDRSHTIRSKITTMQTTKRQGTGLGCSGLQSRLIGVRRSALLVLSGFMTSSPILVLSDIAARSPHNGAYVRNGSLAHNGTLGSVGSLPDFGAL